MKNIKVFGVLAASTMLFSCSSPLVNNNQPLGLIKETNLNHNDILIKLDKSTALDSFADNLQSLGYGKVSAKYKDLNLLRLIPDNKLADPENEISLLKGISYLERDSELKLLPFSVYSPKENNFSLKFIPNDPQYLRQWNIPNIRANQAWDYSTGSSEITVAVLDSGVDPSHPDLKANLLPLIDAWAGSGRSDTYTVNGNTYNYAGKDGNGHGTHVTGILGALINNNTGIAGVAGNVKILPIKVTNHQGNTSASVIVSAILKAVENKVNVINMSIGGSNTENVQSLKDAVDLAIEKGIVFVAAAGNESKRHLGEIQSVTIPAAYEGVISVAANTEYDKVANYSNGGDDLEISAPGGGLLSNEGRKIYSTWPTYITYEGYQSGISGSYALLSGTSMSSPHVAAAAALLMSKEPGLTPAQVRMRLLATATDIEASGYDQKTGHGKLNVYRSLTSNSHDLR